MTNKPQIFHKEAITAADWHELDQLEQHRLYLEQCSKLHAIKQALDQKSTITKKVE